MSSCGRGWPACWSKRGFEVAGQGGDAKELLSLICALIADPDGSLSAQLAVVGLPMTFFLDDQHRIVARVVGAGTMAEFERALRLALGQS